MRKICTEEFTIERFLKMFCDNWRHEICMVFSFKVNPNFQGILNWIIQTLHYYCWKQHKNIENSRIIEKMLLSLCSSLCLLRLALPSSSSIAGYFQFLDTVLNVTSDQSWCIFSLSALKWSFSKLSLAWYHCLHKKPYIFHASTFQCRNLPRYCNLHVQIS